MSITLTIEKNVSIIEIDTTNTTAFLDSLTTKLVSEHNGEYFAFAPQRQFVKFKEEEDLNDFLNEWGKQVRVQNVNIVK